MHRALPFAALVLVPALALGHEGHDHANAEPAPAPAAAEPTPEQKAAMEAWMKAISPGAAHAALEPMVGTFDAKVSYWMAPDQPAIETIGTSVHSWILGGRFLEQRFEGTSNGQPFSGLGYTGFDNVLGTYVGTWMDSMSTGIMASSGRAEGDGVLAFDATMSDPMAGKQVTGRERVTVKSRDEHVFEMFLTGPDGKEFRAMEVVYKRK